MKSNTKGYVIGRGLFVWLDRLSADRTGGTGEKPETIKIQ